MAQKRWRTWEIIGLLVVLAAGNLLHFVYKWSGSRPWVAVFAAVNESTWEHIKLLVVPWVIWSIVEWLALRGNPSPVLAARAVGLLAGILTIPLLFYAYQGITGQNVDLVNIIIFQVAVLIAFWVSWAVQNRRKLTGVFWQIIGGVVLLGAWAAMVWWTYFPSDLPVFMDPQTKLRGLP